MQQIRTPIGGEEYREALGTVRAAKNVFWWLALACLIVQLAAFVLVRFAGLIDHAPQVEQGGLSLAAYPSLAPAMAPALAPMVAPTVGPTLPGAAPAGVPREVASLWYTVLSWALPCTKFVAMLAAMLLALTLLVAVQLSLLGRTGGAAGFLSAFFWALVLWACLVPWEQALNTSLASGALFNLGHLVRETRLVAWGAQRVSTQAQVLYYARFLAYPGLALCLLLMVHGKYARGQRRMTMGVAPAEVSPAKAKPAEKRVEITSTYGRGEKL
jgi:hypothetical protein